MTALDPAPPAQPSAPPPRRARSAALGLLGLLVAPIGPALVALAPVDSPLGAPPVAVAGAVMVISLLAAAFKLLRAVGADAPSSVFLLVVVCSGPIVVGTGFTLQTAWTFGAQAVVERRWSGGRGDGSVESLERSIRDEETVLAALSEEGGRLGVRLRVAGHGSFLEERRTYERARLEADPVVWRAHGELALASLELRRHGGHDEELAGIAARDVEVRSRLEALRAVGATRLRARLGAPGVDPGGVRFLSTVVDASPFQGVYRSSPAVDHVVVVLGDDLVVDDPRVVPRARDRALAELAAIASTCLGQPGFFVAGREDNDAHSPPALSIRLAASRGLQVEASPGYRVASGATQLEVEVRASAHPGFWGVPAWELTTTLRVVAGSGGEAVEAAYLEAVRRVATALGLDAGG